MAKKKLTLHEQRLESLKDCPADVPPLRYMRKEMILTQKEFAEFINAPIRTVQKWEAVNGSSPPEYVIDLIWFYFVSIERW